MAEVVLCIAAQFEISSSALFRHKSKHVALALAKAAESRALASAGGLVDLVEGLIHELGELKSEAKRKRNGGSEARKSVETILKAVQVLADLVGANAPKVSVQMQAQVPTREEAVSIAVETLEAFAPHLLAATAVTVTDDALLHGGQDGDELGISSRGKLTELGRGS